MPTACALPLKKGLRRIPLAALTKYYTNGCDESMSDRSRRLISQPCSVLSGRSGHCDRQAKPDGSGQNDPPATLYEGLVSAEKFELLNRKDYKKLVFVAKNEVISNTNHWFAFVASGAGRLAAVEKAPSCGDNLASIPAKAMIGSSFLPCRCGQQECRCTKSKQSCETRRHLADQRTSVGHRYPGSCER